MHVVCSFYKKKTCYFSTGLINFNNQNTLEAYFYWNAASHNMQYSHIAKAKCQTVK